MEKVTEWLSNHGKGYLNFRAKIHQEVLDREMKYSYKLFYSFE